MWRMQRRTSYQNEPRRPLAIDRFSAAVVVVGQGSEGARASRETALAQGPCAVRDFTYGRYHVQPYACVAVRAASRASLQDCASPGRAPGSAANARHALRSRSMFVRIVFCRSDGALLTQRSYVDR